MATASEKYVLGLRLQGTSRDVLAIMHSIPLDRGDRPIRFLYGFRKIAAARGDSQYTASGSLPYAVSPRRAGMKDKAFPPLLKFFKSSNLFAALIRTGI